MRVKYVGHPDGCDLVREDGGWQAVEHGEVIEVSQEHGLSLLEQPSNWKNVDADKPVSKLTVTELDDEFGHVDGYPSTGNKAAKVAFAEEHLAKGEDDPQAPEQPSAAGESAAEDTTTP